MKVGQEHSTQAASACDIPEEASSCFDYAGSGVAFLGVVIGQGFYSGDHDEN